MKKSILESRGKPPYDSDWSHWRIVWLLEENKNTWKIWSWKEPFGRYIHKNSIGLRVKEL